MVSPARNGSASASVADAAASVRSTPGKRYETVDRRPAIRESLIRFSTASCCCATRRHHPAQNPHAPALRGSTALLHSRPSVSGHRGRPLRCCHVAWEIVQAVAARALAWRAVHAHRARFCTTKLRSFISAPSATRFPPRRDFSIDGEEICITSPAAVRERRLRTGASRASKPAVD